MPGGRGIFQLLPVRVFDPDAEHDLGHALHAPRVHGGDDGAAGGAAAGRGAVPVQIPAQVPGAGGCGDAGDRAGADGLVSPYHASYPKQNEMQ